LITSTSEVYGKSQKPAFSEEDDLLIGPPHLGRWSYACSKLMDEFLALAYAQERKLPVTIARYLIQLDRDKLADTAWYCRDSSAQQKRTALQVYGDGAKRAASVASLILWRH